MQWNVWWNCFRENKNLWSLPVEIANLLPEWLELKNDFNETKWLIDDIRTEMNKVKASKKDLNKLIIDVNNNKVKKEEAVERLNKSVSELDQLKQKETSVF